MSNYLLFMILLFLFAKSNPGAAWPWNRDDTDGKERSGLNLYIDHRTGCHYLGTPNGGLTPRLDAKGKHICEAK